MNFNKTFVHLRNRCLNLPKLSSCKSSRSNSVLCTKVIDLKHNKILPKQISFCFYSSATNAPVITVPTLHFEDGPIEQPVTHDNLCNALQMCDSVDDQMLALTSALALSPDDIQLRIKFCKNIESLLRPFFGEIRIQMFGSSVNGFGFKGCDIDMSFETFAQEKEISYLETPDVPLVSEVLYGKVSPKEISSLPPKEQLIFIHSVLLEFFRESEEPTIFISAYVPLISYLETPDVPLVSEVLYGKVSPTEISSLPPREQLDFIHSVLVEFYRESEERPILIKALPLVRFHHDKYGLKCDLTCRNRVAFSNTKLLFLLGRLDERVIPLMMTIRYWAKHVGIIGKGLMFNTYTISLMVIHFLQTRNPPILPSAEHILSLSDSLKIDDMSDKSFLAIRKCIPPSENTQTISDLLKDFFFYYAYFDFTRVICPLIGGSVSREQFFSKPDSKKFRMNSICVQDPMLVSHNVAELVNFKHCIILHYELVAGCGLFQDNSVLSPSSSKWGLLALFDKPKEYFSHLKSGMSTLSFPVPLISKHIFSDRKKENAELFTAESLLKLLNYVLLFECRTLETSDMLKMLKSHDEAMEQGKKLAVDSKNQCNSAAKNHYHQKKKAKTTQKFDDALIMLEDFQKLNLKNKLILCAECKVTQNVFPGRSHISLESLPENTSNNLMERERYISIHAAKQNAVKATEKLKPFTFFLECYASTELPESTLLINLRPFQKTNFKPFLGIFLREYIPNLIKNLNDNC